MVSAFGGHVDVTAGAIQVADGFGVVAQILRGENAAGLGLEVALDLLVGEYLRACDPYVAHVVLRPFGDRVNKVTLPLPAGSIRG